MPNIDIKNNISFNKFKTDSEYRSIVLTIISAVFFINQLVRYLKKM